MLEFTMGSEHRPAVLYGNGATLLYRLALNSSGTHWAAPKVVDAAFGGIPGSVCMISVDNNPTVAWIDSGAPTTFKFIQGNGPEWTSDIIPVSTGTSVNPLSFLTLVNANGQPAVLASDSVLQDILFFRSTDGGTTWPAQTIIGSAALLGGSTALQSAVIPDSGLQCVVSARRIRADRCGILKLPFLLPTRRLITCLSPAYLTTPHQHTFLSCTHIRHRRHTF